ncbi:MAG TPA: hypothetical protein VFW98_12890 [Gemmatimonadaceae bacterium]|nr:hypothetical protein [Gemmatimonadaceae bacterium]
MSSPPAEPDREPLDADKLVSMALDRLRDTRDAMARLTGGAAPAIVLAELAQKLAEELAVHFDELPMHRFVGRVARVASPAGVLLPHQRVPHRLVLGRYLSAAPPQPAGGGLVRHPGARIAILALGSDGVLRSGRHTLNVLLPSESELTVDVLAWDNVRLRRIPARAVRLSRWNAGSEPVHVARPGEVLLALAAIASAVADAANRDLALLQSFLQRDQR